MCSSNAKRACTNMMEVLPRLNEQQCQYLQTELTKAMDNIAEHKQVVTVFTLYKTLRSENINLGGLDGDPLGFMIDASN